MPKYTLSSLINSLVEFEKTVVTRLKSLSENLESPRLHKFVEEVDKRINKLTFYKTSMVVEMVLEPITGLDIEEIRRYIESIAEEDALDAIKLILNTYIDTYKKVFQNIYSISIDVAMLLDQFRRDANKVLRSLEHY